MEKKARMTKDNTTHEHIPSHNKRDGDNTIEIYIGGDKIKDKRQEK